MNFGEALVALKQGKMAQRSGWNGKGLFVFMQIPSGINKEIVPKMQSLPPSVKDEFQRRFEAQPLLDGIKYDNQLALVHPDNSITGWAPSVSDALASDWVILE